MKIYNLKGGPIFGGLTIGNTHLNLSSLIVFAMLIAISPF